MLKKYVVLGVIALVFGALVVGCGKQGSNETVIYSISGIVSWTETGTQPAFLMVFAGTDPDFPFDQGEDWVTTFEAKVVTGTSEATYNLPGLSSGTYYVGAIGYVGVTFEEPTTGDRLGEYSDGLWPPLGNPEAIAATGSQADITGKSFTLEVIVP